MKWEKIRNGEIKLRPADLLFTRGSSAFGKAIRWATTGKGEKKSIVNHVAGVTSISIADSGVDYKITEALSRVRTCSIYEYDNGEDGVIIVRAVNLSDISRWIIVDDVKRSVGQVYSPLRIVGQLIDNLIMKIIPCKISFFDRISVPFSKICSVLWSVPYSKHCFKFGASSPLGLDPDEMLDYVFNNPEQFQIVFVSDNMEKFLR